MSDKSCSDNLNSQKMHDLREALRTLRLAVGEIERGYRFEDDLAEAKLEALKKAVAFMEDWAELLYGKI